MVGWWLWSLTLEQACLLVIAASTTGLLLVKIAALVWPLAGRARRRWRGFRWKMRQPDSVPNRVRDKIRRQ